MKEITAEYLAEQGLSPTFPKRFWSKVNKNGPIPSHCPELGPCWVWIAAHKDGGYGVIGKGNAEAGLIRAPRASWILEYGPIEEGLDILHRCDNPPCIRPSHLFCGTARTNGRDAASKHRTIQGKNHWNVRLTEQEVLEIRSQYVKWSKNHEELAKRYGISIVNVRHILYRRSWKHI